MNAKFHEDVQWLSRHLEQQAGEYFAPLAGKRVEVALVNFQQRRYSWAYEFDVSSHQIRHGVFVKVPVASSAQASFSRGMEAQEDRPRLVPLLPVDEEAELEHRGLLALEAHFGQQRDQRIAAPRVLDRVQDAIIMESIRWPTVAERLRKSHLWKSKSAEMLLDWFGNAGRWLRRFHHLPPAPTAVTRVSTREEYKTQIAAFVDYLQQSGSAPLFLPRLATEVAQRAEQCLPKEFELAIGHGDFGLHNVFARDDGGVIGFDTLAHWLTSPWEDLAYFLLLLETPPPLYLSRSLVCRSHQIRDLRQALLEGYFGKAPIPLAELHLIEILVAMDKWVSAVHSVRRVKRFRLLAKQSRLFLQQKMIIARLRGLLDELSSLAGRGVPTRNLTVGGTLWKQAL